MTIELVKILEAALNYHATSLETYKAYQNEEDAELKENLWGMCELYTGKCEGLLMAYEILTGRIIYSIEIKDELLAMA